MKNHVFDSFERSEFSDEMYAMLGRAMTVATRFDASCKLLARLPLMKIAFITKFSLNDEQFSQLLSNLQAKFKNLNRAIDSLGFTGCVEGVLKSAREARNELIHEAALGAEMGFDHAGDEAIDQLVLNIRDLVLQMIKGDALVSIVISDLNNEPVSPYPFSKEYESRYVNWVMERF